LAQRMFFARHAKQQRAERDSNDALAKEKSHNALAQLSACEAVRKTKAHQCDMAYASYPTEEAHKS